MNQKLRLLDEIWQDIIKFNDKFDSDWRNREIIFLSNAIAGETGELCNKIKKLYGGGTNKVIPTNKDIAFECFDIFVYMVMLLESIGIKSPQFSDYCKEKLSILYSRIDRVEELI